MYKLIGIFLITITFAACGPSKTVQESRKVIKGDWTLNTISYSEEGDFKATLLNDASGLCFEGSDWKFVPNNNRGTYQINKADCPEGKRHYIFVIQEVDPATGLYDFLLKPTNAKYKSETNAAFRFRLAALSSESMRWEQTVDVDGSPLVIAMNFSKTYQ